MEYNPVEIEKKWQEKWKNEKPFRAEDNSAKPKYYVLDMFPYPSGAGLHVGHPLGYIASDIIARYKRLKGFNVLHPMGYDSFGLPAEQYAIQTGQHPAVTTEKNIARYREQLDRIGFSFDWDREVRTSDPKYYKWTQWIFIQLFKSWYNPKNNKAESIETLVSIFEKEGFKGEEQGVLTGDIEKDLHPFTAEEWKNHEEKKQQEILMHFRLAYLSEAYVNWCPALGTVLANDEVKDGVSERGGHPVERKLMKQWSLRITAYAQRLLDGLNEIDWSDSIKEAQRNWIGKSEGCSIRFGLIPGPSPVEKGDKTYGYMNPGYFTSDYKSFRLLIDRAKSMRSNPTKAESVIWEELRNKLIGYKFRRQHIIDKYIVDFVCLSRQLVIEIDGDIHDFQKEEDEARTFYLNNCGFKVIRFRNEEVINHTEDVVKKIKQVVSEIEENTKPENDVNIVNEDGEEYSFSKGFSEENSDTLSEDVSFKYKKSNTNLSLSSKDHKEFSQISPSPLENDNTTNLSPSPLENDNTTNLSPSPRERGPGGEAIEVFTTRPDTLFGVSYLTLAPELDMIMEITTPEQKEKVEAYVAWAKNRSERERQADVKNITGEFTGAYAIHPFTGEKIPVWVGDYVLAGYGTGAVMAVPAHDSRDHAFAKHFGLPIKQVVETPNGFDLNAAAWEEKSGKVINSDFLNGLEVKDAIKKCIAEVEKKNIGKGKTNYRLRDAVFGRQRYWGEPIPVYYKNGIPYTVEENDLPIVLPEVDKYLPTEDGEPPLARAKDWYYIPGIGISSPSPRERGSGGEAYAIELTTMPGWAGSSWYFLRYMDPHNAHAIAAKEKLDYWKEIDLYVGGAEHATGHLLYFRFWTKFLKDLGHISIEEPAKKLINQGMIQGVSSIVNRMMTHASFVGSPKDNSELLPANEVPPIFISKNKSNLLLKKWVECSEIEISEKKKLIQLVIDHKKRITETLRNKYPDRKGEIEIAENDFYSLNMDINFDKDGIVIIDKLRNWREEYKNAIFILEDDGNFICEHSVEKMSKSKWNVVNPDDLCEKYGADTLRCYEMFLGPLTDHKPWDTKGIEGTFRFLKKLWRLYDSFSPQENNGSSHNSPSPREKGPGDEATPAEFKSLHKCIKRVNEDLERYSFNTVVSTFMICVNELTDLKCHKKAILEPLVVLISPYAPHIAEELWQKLGHTTSITHAQWPELNELYLVEDNITYPVQFNGKLRFNIELAASLTSAEIEKEVMAHEQTAKYLEGKSPKKVIVVPKRIVNIVV
ncbi:MAG: DUF559 domain-containing protein [Bacteroidota bacterium]